VDSHIHQPRITQKLIPPHELEQHLTREHLPGPAALHNVGQVVTYISMTDFTDA
jgi:hypothetical protein